MAIFSVVFHGDATMRAGQGAHPEPLPASVGASPV